MTMLVRGSTEILLVTCSAYRKAFGTWISVVGKSVWSLDGEHVKKNWRISLSFYLQYRKFLKIVFSSFSILPYNSFNNFYGMPRLSGIWF